MIDTPSAAFICKVACGFIVLVFSGIGIYFDIIQDRLTKRDADKAIEEANAKERTAEEDGKEKARRIAKTERANAELKKGWTDTASELAIAKAALDETRKSASVANKRAEALEEKQRDRTLTLEQRAQFMAFSAQAPKGKVKIKTLMSDTGEPRRFALLLKAMLEDAGFTVLDPMLSFMVTGGEISGVWLKIRDKDSVPPHTGVLQNGFGSIGIKAQASIEDDAFHAELEADTVVIYVYKKE